MMMQSTPAGRLVAGGLLSALIVANIAGYAFDFYGQFWWFDRVLRGCTTLAGTLWLALFVFARGINRQHLNCVAVVLLLASVGIALGAPWEVAEGSFDQITPGNVIKGKHDTLSEIVMNTIGAVLAGLMALKLTRSSRSA